jgi:hypothetical protein
MESPSSYKVFEKSQYNRQAVVQYRTKLFPMHITPKSVKTKKVKKKKNIQQIAFNKIKAILLTALEQETSSNIRSSMYASLLERTNSTSTLFIQDITGLSELRLCPLKLKKYYDEHKNLGIYLNSGNYNALCEIKFNYNTTSNLNLDNDTTSYYQNSISNIASFVRHQSENLHNENSYFGIVSFDFQNGVNYIKERIENLLDSLEACLYDSNTITIDPTSKTKGSKITYCNFGIEIEYEGPPVPNALKPQLLKLGAVDFHSGIDGMDDNVENYCGTPCRLYEVRLRIDGFRGLPALYFLVDYMLNNGCIIPTTGSIHCHVDYKWDISLYSHRFDREMQYQWLNEKSHNIANRHAYEEVIRSIFRFPEFNFKEIYDKSRIRIRSHFNTFEYRFMTPLLNYKSIVADIMTVSHMARCFKANVPMNLELLKKIDIAKKVVLNERPLHLTIPEKTAEVVEIIISQEESIPYPFRDIIEGWRRDQLISEDELRDFIIGTRIS